MREDRLREMQLRMLRNYRNFGIGMLVMAPGLWLFAPLGAGWYLGGLTLNLGITSLLRTATLSRAVSSSSGN
jgi:hypothetical protein